MDSSRPADRMTHIIPITYLARSSPDVQAARDTVAIDGIAAQKYRWLTEQCRNFDRLRISSALPFQTAMRNGQGQGKGGQRGGARAGGRRTGATRSASWVSSRAHNSSSRSCARVPPTLTAFVFHSMHAPRIYRPGTSRQKSREWGKSRSEGKSGGGKTKFAKCTRGGELSRRTRPVGGWWGKPARHFESDDGFVRLNKSNGERPSGDADGVTANDQAVRYGRGEEVDEQKREYHG